MSSIAGSCLVHFLGGAVEFEFSQSAIRRRRAENDRPATGKWKVKILCEMIDGPIRPGQLKRVLQGVSRKIIAENLRQLESARLITRIDLSDRTLHVQYRLTDGTRLVLPSLLQTLASFGALYSAAEINSCEGEK
jgi:DNA-binding HxlR family transcriptional regulator